MDLVTLVMFCMAFLLALVFSGLSVILQKAEWSFLAMISWFSFALLNIGFATDALFYPITYFYWILGVIFFVFGIRDILLMMNFKKRQKAEQEQFEVE